MKPLRIAFCALVTLIFYPLDLLGWNIPGHMLSGAIAYQILQRESPTTIPSVRSVLANHPWYETRWKSQLGITAGWDDLSGKRLELLKETFPKTTRDAVLWNSTYGHSTQWKASQAAAKDLKLQLYSMKIQTLDDFEAAFREAIKAQSEALAVTQSSEIGTGIQRVIRLATKHRLPAIYAIPEYAESGGLIAYGGSRTDLARHAAVYVDKILKGAKAADLPVEQPTKFELVINLQTAKRIGVAVPPNVLARADRVIK